MKTENNLPKEQFIAWELASHDALDVKRCYVDIAGDLVAGILLSQIIYWHLPNKKGKSKLRVQRKGNYWIAKKREAWWDGCRITAKQFDRASALLKNKALIEMQVFKFNGAPMKHIRLNWEKLLNILDISQRVKSILPKDEDGNLPKAKIHLDETAKTLTETKDKDYIIKTTTTDTEMNTNLSSSISFDLSELNSPINLSKQALKALNKLADNNKRQEVLDVLAASMKKTRIKKPEAYLQTLIKRYLANDFTPIKPQKSLENKMDSKQEKKKAIEQCPYCDQFGHIHIRKTNGNFNHTRCSHPQYINWEKDDIYEIKTASSGHKSKEEENPELISKNQSSAKQRNLADLLKQVIKKIPTYESDDPNKNYTSEEYVPF